jgi:hypothetical protein
MAGAADPVVVVGKADAAEDAEATREQARLLPLGREMVSARWAETNAGNAVRRATRRVTAGPSPRESRLM